MIGLLIYTNLDLLYLPTVSTLGEVTPILLREDFDEFESKLIKHYIRKGDISEIMRVSDLGLIGNKMWTLHSCGVNPIDKARFVICQYKDPVLRGIVQDYDVLKGIFLKEGTLNFSKYLEEVPVKYYRVPPASYPNDLSIDCDPFEFLLIQNGLSRIDSYPFEPDDLNTESNTECWRRYGTKRVEIYEVDSLPR